MSNTPLDPLQQARQLFTNGLAHFEAARLIEAEQCFEAALALAPGRPSLLTNLGAVRVLLGKHAPAVPLLEQACEREPDNQEAWSHLGLARAALGHHADALAAFDRVLALNPQSAPAWNHRGTLLRELGQLRKAALSYEQALALGADPQVTGYFLAAVRGQDAPQHPPREYVEFLFDGYAADFSQHLTGALAYRAPQRLVEGLTQLGARRFTHVMDLGCGTGLCGPLLATLADRVDGVDLSASMLSQARATGAYTELVHADIHDWLRVAQTRFDLVLAADVFIYVGALEAVFEGVARILAPGGLFAFTVEALEGGADRQLMPSLRFAHSQTYVQRLAQDNGLTVQAIQRAPLRQEQGRPIEGLYVYLRG